MGLQEEKTRRQKRRAQTREGGGCAALPCSRVACGPVQLRLPSRFLWEVGGLGPSQDVPTWGRTTSLASDLYRTSE